MKNVIARVVPGLIALIFCFGLSGYYSPAVRTVAASSEKAASKGETVTGELEVITECDGNNSRTEYFLNSENQRLRLDISALPKHELKTGTKMSFQGTRKGDTFVASSEVTQVQTSSFASIAAVANTTGEQKVLVMLVNFQDKQTQPYTAAQAQDVTFNTVSNFYRENSYGQTWLTGDVYGWYTIPVNSTICDKAAIATAAKQAAANAGANLSQYSHYVYAFPQTSACAFSGSSSIGGNPSESWINTNNLAFPVLSHELGHGFGLAHSRSMDCGSAVIGGSCTTNEYGDTFDDMGATEGAHFNAYQKERLGWLNSAGSPPIQTITASGTYWIDAYETTGTAAKGLKVLKSVDPTTGYKTWYYLEHRTGTGFDSFLANYGVQNGVAIHTGNEGNGTEIYLLDTTPATMNWYDAGLTSGQTFTDSSAGVTLTTVSADNTGAWVQVTVGSQSPSCTRANPTVTVSPGQSQWLQSATMFTYSVTVKNNEGSGCSTSNYNLQDSVPAGWSASYSTISLTVAPGASATASLSVTSPAGTPDGTYNVNAAAVNGSNSSYSGAASATYSIVSALGVTVSSGATTYSRTQKATVTATVRAGGSAVSGAAIAFTMTKPDGSVATQTVTTGSNGSAVFTYTFNKRKDPLGTYQVKAVSSANGLTGQGTTSFLVNK